jgi:hypothetical protein
MDFALTPSCFEIARYDSPWVRRSMRIGRRKWRGDFLVLGTTTRRNWNTSNLCDVGQSVDTFVHGFKGPAVSMLLVSLIVPLCSGQTAAKDPSPHTSRFVRVERRVTLEVLDWGGSGRPLVLLSGGEIPHTCLMTSPPGSRRPSMSTGLRGAGLESRVSPRRRTQLTASARTSSPSGRA